MSLQQSLSALWGRTGGESMPTVRIGVGEEGGAAPLKLAETPVAVHSQPLKLSVGTYNPQTLTGRLPDIDQAMSQQGLQILFLPATQNQFPTHITFPHAKYFCCTRTPNDPAAGVTIGVSHAILSLFPPRSITLDIVLPGRIMALRLTSRKYDITLIAAYAPGEQWGKATQEHYWTTFSRYVRTLPKRTWTIIGTDANGSIGRSPSPTTPHLGLAGATKWTSNGYHLQSFLVQTGMFASNTLRTCTNSGWTWESPSTTDDKPIRTRIDYLLLPVALQAHIVTNQGADPSSPLLPSREQIDHIPVLLQVSIPSQTTRYHPTIKTPKPFDLSSLKQDCLAQTRYDQNTIRKEPLPGLEPPPRLQQYRNKLQAALASPSAPTPTEEFTRITTAMRTTLQEVYPPPQRTTTKRQHWMTPALETELQAQRAAWTTIRLATTPLGRGWEIQFRSAKQLDPSLQLPYLAAQYPQHQPLAIQHIYYTWHNWYTHRNHLNQQIKQAKSALIDRSLAACRKAALHNDMKTAWSILHRYTKTSSPLPTTLHTPQGTPCHTPQEQCAEINRYLETTLHTLPTPSRPQRPLNPRSPLRYTPTDVTLRLSQLPMDKAVPIWSLPSAAYSGASDILGDSLCPLWNHIAHYGEDPEQWSHLQVVWLGKPGKDSSRMENRRPICLSDPAAKAYLSQLNTNTTQHLLGTWRPTTYGALPHRSCSQAILNVNLILHHTAKHAKHFYAYFGDASKAFDLFKRDKLLHTFNTQVTDPQLLLELTARHHGTKLTTIVADHSTSTTTTEGVPQGDPLAPQSFVMGYEAMQRDMDRAYPPSDHFAYTVPRWIPTLRDYPLPHVYVNRGVFVDDYMEIDTITTRKEMSRKLRRQIRHKKEWGVHENPPKAQALMHSTWTKLHKPNSVPKIPVNQDQVTITSNAKYLGSFVHIRGNAQPALDYRIQQTAIAWRRFQPIWRSSALTVAHKLELYRICVTSVLLYSLESHVLTTAQEATLEKIQNRHLRALLKRPAHITHDTNHTIRVAAQVYSIHTQLRHRRLHFLSRILRYGPDHVATLALLFGTNLHSNKSYTSPWLQQVRKDIGHLVLTTKQPSVPYTDMPSQILWCLKCNKKDFRTILEFRSPHDPAPKTAPHESSDRYVCLRTGCEYAAVTWAACVKHMKTAHSMQLPNSQLVPDNTCSLCGKHYSSLTSAIRHVTQICIPRTPEDQIQRALVHHSATDPPQGGPPAPTGTHTLHHYFTRAPARSP
jgi:Reverse transcriptase (RNA-dependent DNA polymerase)